MSADQKSNSGEARGGGHAHEGDVARRGRGRAEWAGEGRGEREERIRAQVEERIERAKALQEEHERRAREWVEAKLERARAVHDQYSERLGGRERILASARALFIDKGYLVTSMQDIAEAAGLRKASIYHHFRDKEALFSEIVLEEMSSSTERLRAVIERDGPLRDSLFELAREQLESTRNDGGRRLMMDFQKNVPEERHENVHAMLRTWIDEFTVIFRRATDRGEIIAIDPRVAALFFFHMGAAWAWHGMDDPTLLPPDPESGAGTVVNVLLNGLRPR